MARYRKDEEKKPTRNLVSDKALNALTSGTYDQLTGRDPKYRSSNDQVKSTVGLPVLKGMLGSNNDTWESSFSRRNNTPLEIDTGRARQRYAEKINWKPQKTLDREDADMLYDAFNRNAASIKTHGTAPIAHQLKNDMWNGKKVQEWEKKYGKSVDQIVEEYAKDYDKIEERKNKQFAIDHPVLATLKNTVNGVLMEPAMGINSWVWGNFAPDNEVTKAVQNAAEYNTKQKKQIASGVTHNMGSIGKGAYNFGTNIGERMLRDATGLGALLNASVTAENTRQELKEQGVEGKRANTWATTRGVMDAIATLIGGEMGGSSVSGGSTLGKAGKQFTKQFGLGSAEQTFAELAETLILGDDATYKKEVRDYMARGLSEEEASKRAKENAAFRIGSMGATRGTIGAASSLIGDAARGVQKGFRNLMYRAYMNRYVVDPDDPIFDEPIVDLDDLNEYFVNESNLIGQNNNTNVPLLTGTVDNPQAVPGTTFNQVPALVDNLPTPGGNKIIPLSGTNGVIPLEDFSNRTQAVAKTVQRAVAERVYRPRQTTPLAGPEKEQAEIRLKFIDKSIKTNKQQIEQYNKLAKTGKNKAERKLYSDKAKALEVQNQELKTEKTDLNRQMKGELTPIKELLPDNVMKEVSGLKNEIKKVSNMYVGAENKALAKDAITALDNYIETGDMRYYNDFYNNVTALEKAATETYVNKTDPTKTSTYGTYHNAEDGTSLGELVALQQKNGQPGMYAKNLIPAVRNLVKEQNAKAVPTVAPTVPTSAPVPQRDWTDLLPETPFYETDTYKALRNNEIENDQKITNLMKTRDELNKLLDKERIGYKSKNELTDTDNVLNMFWKDQSSPKYSENGEKIRQKIYSLDKAIDELKARGKEIKAGKDKIKTDTRNTQFANYKFDLPAKATKNDYPGFDITVGTNGDVQRALDNGTAFIAEMSPLEYLQRSAYDLDDRTTLESIIETANGIDSVHEYADAMRRGDKFPIPSLTYGSRTQRGQEGRTRALAAYEAGIDTIPVAIIGEPTENTYRPNVETPSPISEEELNKAVADSIETLEDESDLAPIEYLNEEKAIQKVPDNIQEIAKNNRAEASKMTSVATINTGMFKDGEGRLPEKVGKYWEQWGNKAHNDTLGDITLNSKGVKDSIFHNKLTRRKVDTFAVVPDVIEKGKIIDYQPSWKGRDYDTALIVAPVTINNADGVPEEYITGVIVRRNKDMQKFYTHDAVSVKKNEPSLETREISSDTPNEGEGSSSVYNILRKIADDKAKAENTDTFETPQPGYWNRVLGDEEFALQEAQKHGVSPDDLRQAAANNLGYEWPTDSANVPPSNDVPPTNEPSGNGPMRERGMSRHMGKEEKMTVDIPQEVKDDFINDPDMYEALSNKATSDKALRIYNEHPNDREAIFRNMLTQYDPAALPLGQMIAKDYSAAGNHAMAAQIFRDMGERLTKAGQFSQASILTMLKNDPLTAQEYAERSIDKLNKQGKKEFGKKWNDMSLTKEELDAFKDIEPGDEKALAELYDKIGQRLGKEYPSTMMEKLLEGRKVAMLFNVRTISRNFFANPPTLGMRWMADRVEAVGQNIVHLIDPTFEKTQSLRSGGAGRKIAKQFTKTERYKNLVNGVDEKHMVPDLKSEIIHHKQMYKGTAAEKFIDRWSGNAFNSISDALYEAGKIKSNPHIKGGIQALNKKVFNKDDVQSILETIRNSTYKLLDVTDSPFVKENFVERLGSYLNAQGITNIKDIPDAAVDIAWNEAMKATYKDDSWMVKVLSNVKKGVEKIPGIGKPLSQGLIPFLQAPGNIAARMVDYSPINLTKGIAQIIKGAAKKDHETIRKGIEAAAKGLTGSGLALLGMKLYQSGVLTGDYSQDNKEKSFQQRNGFKPWSLHVAGKYFTFNWMQPFAQNIMAGILAQQAIDHADQFDSDVLRHFGIEGSTAGKVIGAAYESGKAAVNSWFDESPLGDLTKLFSGSYYDRDIAQNVVDVGEDFASAMYPAAGNATAKTIDTTKRNTKDPSNRFSTFLNEQIAKVPVASESLPAAYDTWGDEIKNANSRGEAFFQRFVYPGEYSSDSSDPLDVEIQRLFESTNDNRAFPFYAANKVGDKTLNNKEKSEYQKDMGQRSKQLAQAFVNSKQYKEMDDANRVETLNTLYYTSKAITERDLFDKPVADTSQYKKFLQAYDSAGGGKKGIEAVINMTQAKSSMKAANVSSSSNLGKKIEAAAKSGDDKAVQEMTSAAQSVEDLGFTKVGPKETYIKAKGIDPSLSVEDFGKTYKAIDTNGNQGITQKEVITYLNNNKVPELKGSQIFNMYAPAGKSTPAVKDDGTWYLQKPKKKK